MAIGQQINVNRTMVFSPSQDYGTATATGQMTLVSRENVNVPAGTYTACKFSRDLNTVYASVGRTIVARSTIWVAPNVGVVKLSTQESVTTGSGPATQTSTEVLAVSVQPL